jgi:hypothetical protein
MPRPRSDPTLGQVLLYETRTQVHIDLDEGRVANAAEAMDLPGLDDENVACAGFEFLPVDGPEPAAFSHELDFIVRMPMRPGTTPWQGSEEEHRDIHIAVIGPDELVGVSLKGRSC